MQSWTRCQWQQSDALLGLSPYLVYRPARERRADIGLLTGWDGLRGAKTSRVEEAGPAIVKNRVGMKNNQSGPVNRSTWEADLHGEIPRQHQVKGAMDFHNLENRASRKSREMASTRAHGLRSQPGPRAGMPSMGLASCPCHPSGPCTLLPRLFNTLIPPCFQPQHPLSAVTFPQHGTFSASTVPRSQIP